MLDERYLEFRIGQVQAFWERLDAAGIPLRAAAGRPRRVPRRQALPAPHLPRSSFPAQALTVALYLEGGVRAVEIGGVMFGRIDPETGETVWPELELVRLAIPRRVYTNTHLDYVAEVIERLYAATGPHPRAENGLRSRRCCGTSPPGSSDLTIDRSEPKEVA